MANIAVLGHGVVGSGVLEVLTSHAASIAKRAKEEIHVKYILDLKEFPGPAVQRPLYEGFQRHFK